MSRTLVLCYTRQWKQPISEKLCLKTHKTMDCVENNIHIFRNTPWSEIFTLNLAFEVNLIKITLLNRIIVKLFTSYF
jgi:hypothetical protein